MKKKFGSRLLATLLTIIVVCGLLCSCSSAPKTEELYDRVVELVEASYELNTVFFGEGLPVYDRNLSVYEYLYSDYSFFQYTRDRDIVSNYARFSSEEEIKQAAEKVYSPKLLEEVLYVNAFIGQVLTDVPGGTSSFEARFLSDGSNVYQSKDILESNTSPLIFDYASMKVVSPSNQETVKMTLNAWTADAPETPFVFRLTLVKNEQGIWLLDKLTV